MWCKSTVFGWMMNPAEEKRKTKEEGEGSSRCRIHHIFQWISLCLIFQMQKEVQDITHVYSSPSAE